MKRSSTYKSSGGTSFGGPVLRAAASSWWCTSFGSEVEEEPWRESGAGGEHAEHLLHIHPLVEKRRNHDAGGGEQQILRQLRMNGLVNQGLEVIRHLDREVGPVRCDCRWP